MEEAVAEELVDELVLSEFRATPPAQEQHRIVQFVCDRVRDLEWPSPNRWVRLLDHRDACGASGALGASSAQGASRHLRFHLLTVS